ncbi:hypothetical protein BGX38DRAFT_1152075 [Terfezia claveryi]|nr:hypothetical protein BGX38DRAFT_1152075 [Terfezia claveryi]
MLSKTIQALLTLFAVGMAILIGSANATRSVDPARATQAPGHHPEGAQTCPVFQPASIQDLRKEIVDIKIRLLHAEQGLHTLEARFTNTLQVWQKCCLAKREERYNALENSNKEMNDKFQTLLEKLDDQSRGRKQERGASEGKVSPEEGGKASIEARGKDLTATVSGVPVLGFVIGLWSMIVIYFLYTKEWLARRERRWRLRDELRKQRDISKVSKKTQGEDGKMRL